MLDREWWLRNKDCYVNCHKCDATFHHQFRRRGVFFPDGAVLCDECHERMHAVIARSLWRCMGTPCVVGDVIPVLT